MRPGPISDSGGVAAKSSGIPGLRDRRTPETGDGIAGPAKSFAKLIHFGLGPVHSELSTLDAELSTVDPKQGPSALPLRVIPLESTLAKNVPATRLECALAVVLD